MAKFYNSINPYIKYKRRYHWRMITNTGVNEGDANALASYFWTLGTFGLVTDGSGNWTVDGPRNFDQGNNLNLYYQADPNQKRTDLGQARANFWSDANVQYGSKGSILKNEMIFRFRNNTNIRCFMTVTYFIPRPGLPMGSYLNGKIWLEGLKGQTTATYNPNFDWRQVSTVTQMFKLVVKKYQFIPGQVRYIKFKCGGLPYYGFNNFFDEVTMSTRFTRFMHVMAYGDQTFHQVGTLTGKPLYDESFQSSTPINLSYTCVHKIEGRRIQVPNNYVAQDLTTLDNAGKDETWEWGTSGQIKGPRTVPIGGTNIEWVGPDTNGWSA